MKKALSIVLVGVMIMGFLVGCQSNPAPSDNADPQTNEEIIKDLFGDSVDPMDKVRLSDDGTYRMGIDYSGNLVKLPLPEDIKRVIVVDNSSNQTMVMLGAEDKIVGTTLNTSMAEWHKKINPRISDVYVVNDEGNYNIEEMKNLEPDLIITSGQDDFLMLSEAGFTVIDAGNDNYEEMKQTVTFIGDVLGGTHATKAKEFCEYLDKNIKRVTEVAKTIPESEKVSVFHIRGNLIKTMGANTLADDWITLGGAINSMAKSLDGSKEATIEEVIAVNPDIITVSNVTTEDIYGIVMSDPQWATIKAVKDGRVYKNPVGVYNWDCSACESCLQVLWIPTICYPNYYKDIDMGKEVRWFYQNFYDYSLTDAEVQELLAGEGTPK